MAIPLSGDVVIHRRVHSPAVYVLSTFEGPLQFSHQTYEAAAHQATAFAAQGFIDAWYTADELIFERVARHRPTTSEK